MTPNPYDPKLLEAWFRFMAEATRAGSGASEAMQRMTDGAPPNFAELMTRMYAPADAPELLSQPDAMGKMTEAWLASFGMVPKSRYDTLEAKYEELLEKFRASERTVKALRTGSAVNSEQTQEILKTWEDTVQKTLQAQTAWWQSWAGQSHTSQREADAQGADQQEARETLDKDG